MKALIILFTIFTSLSASAIPVIEVGSLFPGSKFYVPNDGKSHPGIVIIHGSEGGSLPYFYLDAQLLAADGFSVLAFCWYNCGKSTITEPHEMLMNVKLENLINALKWFKQSRFVEYKKLGLYGFSRGAEKALILASMDKANDQFSLDAVAVHAPSDVVVGGFSWAWRDKRCSLCKDDTMSCLGSNDPNLYKWNPMCGPSWLDFADPSKIPAWTFNGKSLKIGQSIEIEKSTAPIFITHGEEDQVWSVNRSRRIEARLNSFGKKAEIHYFPGEGHNFESKSENLRKQLVHDFFKKNLGS